MKAPEKKQLREALREATEYAQWRAAADALDGAEGLHEWRQEDRSEDFDWRLIHSRLRQIRQLRADGLLARLVHHLRQGLHWNLGNIGNPKLYGVARYGTKHLIHDYVSEVIDALNFICDSDFPEMDAAAKLRFFQETAQSFGRSALMLSGGATLGLFHVGVVKALYRESLLPEVISGSSAGSVVAATVGTRTPEELEQLLDPSTSFYHFWKPLKWRQVLRRRVLMDQSQVRAGIARNVRDLTFEEAQRLSGRVINVTVSPAGLNQPPRLLNYLTFPYLFIREAALASSAVPFLFQPVMLMTRDEAGRRVPYMPLLRWTDGSLKSDLPTLRLRRLHNVNHFIVSQTNPHVLPFLRPRGTGDQGIGSALREYVGATARSQLELLARLGGANLPTRVVRNGLDSWASILEQEYQGNITIVPEISVWRYAHVTANPKVDTIRRFILEGERATWPRIEMVRNQTLIGRTFDHCVARLLQHPELRAVRRARRAELAVVRPAESGGA